MTGPIPGRRDCDRAEDRDGLLDLDAPVGCNLSRYRPHPEHGHPTTRQLLRHTAGLDKPLPVRWVRAEHRRVDPAWLPRILGKHGTPGRPVGVQASYSNIGYLLAAEVIQASTGQPIEDCVHDTVLAPLGMNSTGYRYDAGAPRAVGYVRLPRALRPAFAASCRPVSSDLRPVATPASDRSWSTAPGTAAWWAPSRTPPVSPWSR